LEAFDWDDANTEHIARHGVSRDEAEQVIENEPIDLFLETVDQEERFTSVGHTNKGRFLVVVTIVRATRIRVVTAFPASERLTNLYFVRRGKLNQ
jgi:uncharacterized DUF497 family protein